MYMAKHISVAVIAVGLTLGPAVAYAQSEAATAAGEGTASGSVVQAR